MDHGQYLALGFVLGGLFGNVAFLLWLWARVNRPRPKPAPYGDSARRGNPARFYPPFLQRLHHPTRRSSPPWS